MICSKNEDDAYMSRTPNGFNARTTVHEYGGGAAFMHNDVVYFSNFEDQRLYRQNSATDAPEALTPADCGWRYSDGEFSEAVCSFKNFQLKSCSHFVGHFVTAEEIMHHFVQYKCN